MPNPPTEFGQNRTFMSVSFTIIDSFIVSDTLRERGVDLPNGTWYVLDGQIHSGDEIPRIGDAVRILPLAGEAIGTFIAGAEVRHGSAAVTFMPTIDNLPRLSTFSVERRLPPQRLIP